MIDLLFWIYVLGAAILILRDFLHAQDDGLHDTPLPEPFVFTNSLKRAATWPVVAWQWFRRRG